MPDQQIAARLFRAYSCEVVGEYLFDEFRYVRASDAFETDVRMCLEHVERVADRRSEFASIQQGMIVLRISDAHGIVRRERQRIEGRTQSGRFADAGRENHYRVAVEDDVQVQAEFADRVVRLLVIRARGRDDRLAHAQTST